MLFLVMRAPMLHGTDVDAWNPFPEVKGSPYQYPGIHEPSNWNPDPHPYAEGGIWPAMGGDNM
ncbi:hypothetical protein T484DRAFT_1948275 [Baffinella frigidus]|nr:hypothetical protein T484DRAFT_1948275 [Cryptophyta sp. CCMP2293]